jgi:hypothetical protein
VLTPAGVEAFLQCERGAVRHVEPQRDNTKGKQGVTVTVQLSGGSDISITASGTAPTPAAPPKPAAPATESAATIPKKRRKQAPVTEEQFSQP